MRLISKNFPGNLHSAAKLINMYHAARFVLCMSCCAPSTNTVVVFRFEDYPSYVHYCSKSGETPMTTEEFFE